MEKENNYLNRIQNLIIGKSVTSFEDKLLLLATLLITFVLILATITNFALHLKTSLVVSTLVGVFLYLSIYLFGRFISRGNLLPWILGIMTLGYLDLLWFFNHGSSGSIMPFFIVFYAFLILTFDKKYFLALSILTYTNLFLLLMFELRFSEKIGVYTDDRSRLMDSYLGIIFCLLVIFSFMSAIKKNYIHEYERAKMADQLKSSFLANMSHEIRTPLNAIVGFSSLMYDSDITDDEKKHFGKLIEQNSDYLLGLINDIVDVSIIEANQLTLKNEELDIVPILRNLTQNFQGTIAADRQVKVICLLNEPKLIVNTDRDRLVQILRNLLVNAIKYTEKGTIEVNCRQELNFYTFSVKDTGVGIEPKYQQIIFDRFMKIENNKQHLYRGTGIGLFLSKQLVEMFGGEIWIESELGKGSTFFFTIPV